MQKNRRKPRRFTKKRLKKWNRIKDIIKHKGCQKSDELKKCLKFPFCVELISFSQQIKVILNVFNITNKSIIFF